MGHVGLAYVVMTVAAGAAAQSGGAPGGRAPEKGVEPGHYVLRGVK